MIRTVASASLFASDKDAAVVARGKDFEYDTCDNEFSMKRGAATGLLFLDPRPADSEWDVIYPSHYLPYRFDELPWLIRVMRDQAQKSKVLALRSLLPSTAKILDVGCGSGKLLRLMRRHGPPRWELHGSDFNRDVLEPLRRDGFTTHAGPLPATSSREFDCVIMNQVIEHFADVRGALAAVQVLLRPGGLLFLETPSFDGLDARLFSDRYWGGYHFPRHWYLFNAPLLRELLSASGFDVIEERYLASPSFWIQSLHHFLKDKGRTALARFFEVRNIPLLAVFTLFDLATILAGGKTSTMRLVSRRRDG